MADVDQDPVIEACRARIAQLDLAILEAVNARIGLVRRLRAHKASRGLGFRDPAQEARLLEVLARANPGPLSEAGLRDLFGRLLEVVRAETEGD